VGHQLLSGVDIVQVKLINAVQRQRLRLQGSADLSINDDGAIDLKRVGAKDIAEIVDHLGLPGKGFAGVIIQGGGKVVANGNTGIGFVGLKVIVADIDGCQVTCHGIGGLPDISH